MTTKNNLILIRYFTFLFVFNFFSVITKAQNAHKIDSLKTILNRTSSDSIKCLVLGILIEEESNDLLWPEYNQQLFELAQKNVKTLKGNSNQYYTKKLAESINNFGFIEQLNGNIPKALQQYQKSLQLHLKINNQAGIASSYNNIGAIYDWQGKKELAKEYFIKSLIIYEQLKDKDGIAFSYNNLATYYDNVGDISKALEYYHKSIKLYEEMNDNYGLASALLNVSIVYLNQNDTLKALEFQQRSLKIRQQLGDLKGISQSMFQIGSIYQESGNLDEALNYFSKSLDLQKRLNDKQGIAYNLINFGSIANVKGNYEEALKYYLQSLTLREEIEDKLGLSESQIKVGEIYLKMNKIDQSEAYLKKGMELSKELGFPECIRNAASFLSEVYHLKGNYKLSLENYKLYIKMRDSINNLETQKTAIKLQTKYSYEKEKAISDKEHELKIKQQKQLAEAENKRQNMVILGITCLLIVVAIFSVSFYKRYQLTKKQNFIIEEKEKETSFQKKLIETKHKEITDSINYAERIQRSFLATKQHLDEHLNKIQNPVTEAIEVSGDNVASPHREPKGTVIDNYFIFFKPKDVVSGDFYWSATLNNGSFILATADSTGHGVPGAIMSLLNITSLEKAIETHTNTAEILNTTRNIIIERLKRDGSIEGGKDGMDCSLCVYDFNTMQLHMALANNPVWIVRSMGTEALEVYSSKVASPLREPQGSVNKVEVIEIKPDKMPVGKHDKQDIPFTTQSIQLQKGDVIYTLTDGFPDQFGGEKGKKFMSKNLRELLAKNAHLPMHEQKQLLETTFSKWISDLEQVDDVTVIGVRV